MFTFSASQSILYITCVFHDTTTCGRAVYFALLSKGTDPHEEPALDKSHDPAEMPAFHPLSPLNLPHL